MSSKCNKKKKPPGAQEQKPPASQTSARPPTEGDASKRPLSAESPVPAINPNRESKHQSVAEKTQSNLTDVKKPNLQNQTDIKEVSPLTSKKEDSQKLGGGDSNKYCSIVRRLFGSRLSNHGTDEEQGVE